MTNDNIKFSYNIRLPKDAKPYWLNQLQKFANHFASMQVHMVQFGKQDLRGVPSITLVDMNHCVPRQEFFQSGKELLAFVQGYNMAQSKFDRFADYKKGIFKAA
jgi:hypothetical protein